MQKRPRSGIRSGEREYIPAYRSGPYALLITLNRDRQVSVADPEILEGGGVLQKRHTPSEIAKKLTNFGSRILSFTNIRWFISGEGGEETGLGPPLNLPLGM
jgi:hypothetical protein